MSYINAKSVLPKEMIEEIQKYVNGVNLYIPKVPKKGRIIFLNGVTSAGKTTIVVQ